MFDKNKFAKILKGIYLTFEAQRELKKKEKETDIQIISKIIRIKMQSAFL